MARSVYFFLTITFLFSTITTKSAFTAPINSNVALPVEKGGLVFRSQMRWIKSSDDPTSQNRERDVIIQPNVLLYGATENLALFAIFPYLFRTRKFPDPETGKRINQKQNGPGDLSLIARYTAFTMHLRSGELKIAPLVGLKIPTGDEDLRPITSGSYDFEFGAVTTASLNNKRHKLVGDAVYRINTEADNFEKGDSLTYDFSFHHRIFPWNVPEGVLKNFVQLVAESNGVFAKRNSIKGITDKNSGGHILFVAPGIQTKVSRFIVESSFQIPVIQDLNGKQIEPDFAWTVGIIINFFK